MFQQLGQEVWALETARDQLLPQLADAGTHSQSVYFVTSKHLIVLAIFNKRNRLQHSRQLGLPAAPDLLDVLQLLNDQR